VFDAGKNAITGMGNPHRSAEDAHTRRWARRYWLVSALVFGVEVLLVAALPVTTPPLRELLSPGLLAASLFSLEGTDMRTAGIWLGFGLGLNALLYGAGIALAWRWWSRKSLA
jgi:hypothetical protein